MTGDRTGNPDALIRNMIVDSPRLMSPRAGAHFVSLPEPQLWYRPPEAPEQSYYAFHSVSPVNAMESCGTDPRCDRARPVDALRAGDARVCVHPARTGKCWGMSSSARMSAPSA
jgi:hypothetical protein